MWSITGFSIDHISLFGMICGRFYFFSVRQENIIIILDLIFFPSGLRMSARCECASSLCYVRAGKKITENLLLLNPK